MSAEQMTEILNSQIIFGKTKSHHAKIDLNKKSQRNPQSRHPKDFFSDHFLSIPSHTGIRPSN